MKPYLKTLCITLPIQILAFLTMLIFDTSIGTPGSIICSLLIGIISIIISMIISIILAIKNGQTIKQKLLMIFLMPTNYTLIAAFFFAYINIINAGYDIISQLSPNFG